MKVEEVQNRKAVPFRSLKPGDLFRPHVSGRFYVKSVGPPLASGTSMGIADGDLLCTEPDVLVHPYPNARVVLEGGV